MGIERFYSSLKNEKIFKDLFHPYNNTIIINNLFIDMNSIIHNISSYLLKHKTFNNTLVFENKLINDILKYLVNLKNMFSDIKLIYIAIDGVPSLPKINEQKNRRYIGAITSMLLNKIEGNYNKFTWSKDNISTYSEFMKKLVERMKSNEFTKNFNKIIISSMLEKGEGEMKIIKYIKNNNIKEGIIFSPDSDMILLLGLLDRTKLNNYVLLRLDNVIDIDKNLYKYNYTNIKPFHDFLLKYFNSNDDLIIKDIIYIMTLFGNDFLPKLECLRIESDILLFLEVYRFNLKENGNILRLENNKYKLNIKSLITFLEILQSQELMLLQRNRNVYQYFEYNKNARNHLYHDIDNIVRMIKQYKVTEKDYIKSIPYMRVKLSDNTMNPFGFLKYKIIQNIKYNNILSQDDNILFMDNRKLFDKLYLFLIKNKDNYKRIFNVDKKYNYFYRKLTREMFDSKKNNYHLNNIKKLDFHDQLLYKIEYKLDEFYEIFDRTDLFYKDFKINEYSIIKNITNKDVNDYIEGLIWMVNYYINTDDSMEFVYRKIKSPLLKPLIEYISTENISLKKAKDITIEEHRKLISPDLKLLNKYLSNNFKGILDCSSSIFTSKCHVII